MRLADYVSRKLSHILIKHLLNGFCGLIEVGVIRHVNVENKLGTSLLS